MRFALIITGTIDHDGDRVYEIALDYLNKEQTDA